ncbi:iridoid oxidase [Hevea brasiliensis]|nr:iridoid oxidase [Hevea brasiliensis]
MEYIYSVLVCTTLFLSLALVISLNGKKRENGTKKLPPGPPGWPLLGNIFDLGTVPHQTLRELKLKYGPVLRLRLGSMETVVIQSAKAAAELFKNHDASFCDRKCLHVLTSHNYRDGSLAVGQFSPYWRMLRRLCSMEMMTSKRINETASIRRKCIYQMIRSIEDNAVATSARGESVAVNLPHYLSTMAFNIIGNLMLSRDLLNSQSKEGYEFFQALGRVVVWAGKPNVADFLPFLQWLDPQRLKKNMLKDLGRTMEIIEGFVKERIEQHKRNEEKAKDFLDALLEFEGDGKDWPEKIPYEKIIIIILEMFFAGSETTSAVVEWAMAELLRNPEAMRKVKEELDEVVGVNRNVEESDIEKLPYLQAVLKETFRFHSPIPLLVPRNTIQDTNFMGYHIPKGTQILVNAGAIGRDPDLWEDPLAFKPERFLGSSIDYKGQNFELIPFGSGRRICVGMLLAQRIVLLGLASLIHCFDWELEKGSTPGTLDMRERTGMAVRKLVPLNVIPKKRARTMAT